jgi:two-component system sensor histidine kinase KdpD
MTDILSSTPSPARVLRGYAEAALFVAAATLIGLAIAPRWGNSAVDLIYLPAVLAAAVLAGRGPALLAATGAALAYNFYFTAPRLSFRIDHPNDVLTVLALFAIAIVTSQLAASVRHQARLARAEAARNATIAGLAGDLLGCASEREVVEGSTRALSAIFGCNAVLARGRPEPLLLASAPGSIVLTPADIAVAALVLESGESAGRGLARSVPTEWQFHPVKSGGVPIAAFGFARNDGLPAISRVQVPVLDSLLDQVALALERSRLESEAREFAWLRERDQVRATLLGSIGQDLGVPVRQIAEAVDGLRRQGTGDRELIGRIGAEATRIDRYLANLAELEPESGQQPIAIGGIAIDLFRREVFRDGNPVHLPPKEYAVLAELARHPGRVLTHGHLLRTAWGPAQEQQIDYLRVAIRALRRKLERDPAHPELILNEPAIGYRLRID